MIMFLNESQAKKVFSRTKDVMAFSVGKKKGFSEDGIEISYQKPSFMMSNDLIDGILKGDLSKKTVSKEARKVVARLRDLDDDDVGAIEAGINIYTMIHMMHQRPDVVIVFVAVEGDDDQTKKMNKLLEQYVCELFNELGVQVVTRNMFKEKAIRKLFDSKKYKKVRNAIVAFVTEKHSEFGVGKKAIKLFDRLRLFYSIEVNNTAFNNIDVDDIPKRTRKSTAEALIRTLTGDIVNDAGKLGIKKAKKLKKVAKRLSKLCKEHTEAYGELRDILKSMDDCAIKLPKAEYGAKKDRLRMKGKEIEKFVNFYCKRDNAIMLRAVYAHLTCVRMGADIGSSEYTKYMSAALSSAPNGYSKKFTTAAKAYASKTEVSAG